MQSHSAYQILQNFLLIWLDSSLDESSDEFKNTMKELQKLIISITTFTDIEQCIDFISDVRNEKVFMIVSESVGRYLTSDIEIHEWPQLDSIYVLCQNPSIEENWSKTIPKIKGVFSQMKPICEALQINRKYHDRSLSFNCIDPTFMYTQLLIEALLQIKDDDNDSKTIKEFTDLCRLQNNISEVNISMIEREYHLHTPIWWYTAPYFMCSMLARGFRLIDVDILLKMGFFIRDLYRYIKKLHEEQQFSKSIATNSFRVFRGQALSLEHLEEMKKTQGRLLSFNGFLSTTLNRECALTYAHSSASEFHSHLVGILYVISIDPTRCNTSMTSYALVGSDGFYEGDDEEILFTTHTIFRIERIERIVDRNNDQLWEVHLRIIDNRSHDLNLLMSHIRQELEGMNGWFRIGSILLKLGEYSKAEHLYRLLLEKSSTDENRAVCKNQQGTVYCVIGEYKKALSVYEQSLEIRKNVLPSNHLDIAASYNNIGVVYQKIGEYWKALSSFKRSLEIRSKALPSNHLSLAASYSNIGTAYQNTCEYWKALSCFNKSLEIMKMALPPNHPDLAALYNNIGAACQNMCDYSKALSFFRRSYDIMKIVVPINHPNWILLYNNVGSMHQDMHEYSKALSFFERSLQIMKIVLPPNHPDFAVSYNNIGVVNQNMGDYSRALSYYHMAFLLIENLLPIDHPYIVMTKQNIENIMLNL